MHLVERGELGWLRHGLISVDHSINDPVRLDEEVDVHGRENVSKEVLVHGDKQFYVAIVVDCTPDGAQFLAHFGQVALFLELGVDEEAEWDTEATKWSQELTSCWMIKFAKGYDCFKSMYCSSWLSIFDESSASGMGCSCRSDKIALSVLVS